MDSLHRMSPKVRLAIFVALAFWIACLVAGVDRWPPLGGDSTDAAPTLAQLTIAPETDPASYDRDRFGDWTTDAQGCTTRQRVLIEEATTPATTGPGCQVTGGRWISSYDGATVTDPGALDIDHVVPLAEAWGSGAAAWPPDRLHAYANDLEHPDALTAVTAATNRSKGDQDPAEWLPPAPGDWCRYAAAWISTKQAWQLTVDQAEHDTLTRILTDCPGGTP